MLASSSTLRIRFVPLELSAVSSQIPQFTDLTGCNEAVGHQTAAMQFGDPLGVLLVCLATGEILDMSGISEGDIAGGFKDVEYRFPVYTRTRREPTVRELSN